MNRVAALVCFVALASAPSHADPAPRGGAPREQARTFLVVRIADALKLNEQDALKVSAVVRASDERRQSLVQERRALEAKLRAALAKPEAAELAPLIAAGNDIDQQLAQLPEDTFRNLQKLLTVEQQAKLFLLRRELQGEIRRAVHRRFGGAAHAPVRAPQGKPPRETPAGSLPGSTPRSR
jgi:hypothetical protein